jgi:hypothetical protein
MKEAVARQQPLSGFLLFNYLLVTCNTLVCGISILPVATQFPIDIRQEMCSVFVNSNVVRFMRILFSVYMSKKPAHG